jgi:P4 family phage/plasmid primase-like protien
LIEAVKLCPPISIANRLETYPFRFIKISEFEKIPVERGWQKEKNYSYDDPGLLKHLKRGGNYGVCCGIGSLLVFDIDHPESFKEPGILEKLPTTFTVKTRSGGLHLYYICKDFEKKLILHDSEGYHLGELQWLGSQVVGPSSRFRLDDENKVFEKIQRWEVEIDVPIAEIKQADLLRNLDEAKIRYSSISSEKEEKISAATALLPAVLPTKTSSKRQKSAWSFVDNIRLVDIALPVPIRSDDRDGSGEIQGGHPIHGSDKEPGKENNFAINVKKNVWCCYRCVPPEGSNKSHSGGGPLEYLAVEAGIIDCSEATVGCLKVKGRLQAVLDYARSKGLPVPDNSYLSAKKIGEKKKGLIKFVCETISSLINFKVMVDDSILIYDPQTGCYQYDQANPKAGEQEIVALCREIGGDDVDNYVCREVLGWARGRRRVSIKDFDNIEGLIVVRNGILDMKTGKLSEFTPDFLSLSPCPIAWEEAADTTIIDGYMEWCHPGDKETQDYHWRWFGSLIAGSKGDQVMDLWYSPEGNSGKSTWMLLLQAIAGKQAIWRPPIELFSPGKGGFKGNKQFSLAETEHRKALMASEPGEQTSYLDDQTVKIVTGDPIAGRNPWGLREREVVHEGAVILATNPMLRMAGGTSPPIKRRLRISRWDAKVGDKTIKHYEQVLIATGGPGILKRLVEGYQAYLFKGLKPSPNMEKWLAEFVAYNDPLLGFVDEILTPAAREEGLSFIEIHEAWLLFLRVSGFAGASEDEKKLKLKTYFGREIQKQMAQKGWKVITGRNEDHRGPVIYSGVKFTKIYWDMLAEDRVKCKVYEDAFDKGIVLT